MRRSESALGAANRKTFAHFETYRFWTRSGIRGRDAQHIVMDDAADTGQVIRFTLSQWPSEAKFVTIRVGQVEEPLAPQCILRRRRHALSLAGRVSVCHRVAILPPSSHGLTRDLRLPLGALQLRLWPSRRSGRARRRRVLALILGRRQVIGDLSGRKSS
jgi:hypothetical protein